MDLVRLYLTMVLPAPFGCNLKCPFCAIAQRSEAQECVLSPDAYCLFLAEAATRFTISRFAIQGYEPLLPETWELTKRLLVLADYYNLETALVTNGVLLDQKAEELSGLVDVITVSIDSHDHSRHDTLRGVPGSFDNTVRGIREAVKHFGAEVQVASVLFPGRAEYLSSMPELLNELGVRQWAVAPVLNFRTGAQLGNQEETVEALRILDAKAKAFNVHMYLSDELHRMTPSELFDEMHVRSLEDSDYLVRLSPNGSCSRGTEALRAASCAPVWDQKEGPAEFLERIFGEVNKKIIPT
jgi:molybdenum cofactor biosynthesis enzyme MoaA